MFFIPPSHLLSPSCPHLSWIASVILWCCDHTGEGVTLLARTKNANQGCSHTVDHTFVKLWGVPCVPFTPLCKPVTYTETGMRKPPLHRPHIHPQHLASFPDQGGNVFNYQDSHFYPKALNATSTLSSWLSQRHALSNGSIRPSAQYFLLLRLWKWFLF